jgi:hypothetical protein
MSPGNCSGNHLTVVLFFFRFFCLPAAKHVMARLFVVRHNAHC